jgi:competence protein CoiA
VKYAIFEGSRCEAAPGLRAQCPNCQAAMVAKCGERRVRHWAHKGRRNCDHWWEPESQWHRAWKDEFPAEWQEVVQWVNNGEKHIADVKTIHGRVIEFQHSYLRPEERRARESFYGPMVWIVDGLRLKRSRSQFFRALSRRPPISLVPLAFRFPSKECALVQEWAESQVPVYLDFGDAGEEGERPRFREAMLWRIRPSGKQGEVLAMPARRASFVNAFRRGEPCRGIKLTSAKNVGSQPVLPPRQGTPSLYPTVRRLLSFAQYAARERRARSRMRF